MAVCITKGFGSPIPCAVALAKRQHLDAIKNKVDYIKTTDVTISGSRNGFTPLIAWYIIKSISKDAMRESVYYKLNLAEFVINELNQNGIQAWRNKNSITVIAPRPSESFIHRHKLAPFDDYIHIITTAHNTKATLDRFIHELLLEYRYLNIQE